MDSVWDRWPVHPDRVRTVVESVRRADPFKTGLMSFWPLVIAGVVGVLLTDLLRLVAFFALTGRGVAWPEWNILTGILGPLVLGGMTAIWMHRRWPRSRMNVDRVLAAVDDRPVHRVCPGCGGDPFGATRCCGTVPRSWTAEDLHVWWFEFSESGPYQRGDGSISTEPRDPSRFLAAVEMVRGPDCQALALTTWGIARETPGTRRLVALGLCAVILVVDSIDQWLNAGLVTGGVMSMGWFLLSAVVFVAAGEMLASSRGGINRSHEFQPRCRKCDQVWGSSGIARCAECGTDLSVSTVRFGSMPKSMIPIMTTLGGLLILLFVIVRIERAANTLVQNPERLVPTSRLIDLASRPIDESAWEDVVAELKSRSTDFTEEEWRAWGEALAAERVGLRYGTFWPLLHPLLERRWHVSVSPETERTLDDLLWNPDFIVEDGPEPGLTRISWSSSAGTESDAEPERKVIPIAMRIDGKALSLPETRPQQSTRTGEWLLDIPSSALAGHALEIEALVYYERRVIPRLNRRGEVIEDPARIEVPTMQADGTLLLPEHLWTRVITRTARPSSPATIR